MSTNSSMTGGSVLGCGCGSVNGPQGEHRWWCAAHAPATVSPDSPSVDPYSIPLAEGEGVVRQGYAVRYLDNGKFRGNGLTRASHETLCRPDFLLWSRLQHAVSEAFGGESEPVHITIIRSPERRELVEVECDGWVYDTEVKRYGIEHIEVRTESPCPWRPIRIIPGTERAVVRRLVPGPVIEGGDK